MPLTKAVAAAVLFLPCAWAAPASAYGIGTQFIIAQIRSATPSCHAYPYAPVVGRVSGIFGGYPSRGASFVGCFDSFATCEAWRAQVSGAFTGRLIYDRCEPR